MSRSQEYLGVLACPDLRSSQEYLHVQVSSIPGFRVGGEISESNLPSLTLLSGAGCGRLQLGVPHWVTTVITAGS